MNRSIQETAKEELLNTIKVRFEKNKNRHEKVVWEDVQNRLLQQEVKLWSLYKMEETGGEPDVIGYNEKNNTFIFCDCSAETPKGRRSLCYDRAALDARKQHKPANSIVDMAQEMGIELLTEEQYRQLQQLGKFDQKTSSWIKTPEAIRSLGGALFCDDSYYAARGFRGILEV